MFSIWEKQSFLQADIIVVGGGILGLSTACSIKEKDPKRSVLVLERGIISAGASTKNAGFACFGSLSELVKDMETLGESKMLALVEKRWRGLALLEQRLGQEAMDFQHQGGFELLTEKQLKVLHLLGPMNELLFPLSEMEVFYSTPSKIKEFGFNKEIVKDIVFNPFEGEIDTGKTMKALIRTAQALGVEILTGAEVTGLHPSEKSVDVEIKHEKENFRFNANKSVVCTNAFLSQLFPEMNVLPGRGQVLITKPIPNLKLKGAFHYDEGFYYFRDYKERVLFGGGRNQDFETETTTECNPNEKILNDLKEKLSTIILPDTPHEIDYTWQGIMGFGASKFPAIETPHPNIFTALGCNGMGLALSSLLGEELSERILA